MSSVTFSYLGNRHLAATATGRMAAVHQAIYPIVASKQERT